MRQMIAVLLLALPLGAQDKKQDDVLQKKDGGLLVGKVLKTFPNERRIARIAWMRLAGEP